jgi:hypothetical protein
MVDDIHNCMPFRFLILFIWIPSLSGKALFTACWASPA